MNPVAHTELYEIVKKILGLDIDQITKDKKGRYKVKENSNAEFIRKMHDWSVHAGMISLYKS